jgi:hypothetical protein
VVKVPKTLKISSILKKNPHIDINEYKKNKAIFDELKRCGLSPKEYGLSSLLTRKYVKTDKDGSVDSRVKKF